MGKKIVTPEGKCNASFHKRGNNKCMDCYFIRFVSEGHGCSLGVKTPDGRRIRDGRSKACERFRPYCFRDFNRPLTFTHGDREYEVPRFSANCFKCPYRD